MKYKMNDDIDDMLQRMTGAKPPLGLMPKYIWIELRAKDLARAIKYYIDEGKYDQVGEWVQELNDLLPDIEKHL